MFSNFLLCARKEGLILFVWSNQKKIRGEIGFNIYKRERERERQKIKNKKKK
jgi:hypothetical protein